MSCKIDFSECLKDSPKFRLHLEEEENDIDHLEQKLDKIVKTCILAVDTGKEYIRNQSAFATSLWDLQRHFDNDKSSSNALNKLIGCLQEMNKFHTILLDQANRTVLTNLTTFLKKDIKDVKEYKQFFTKVSENLDSALHKNSQVNKNRPQEIIEAENILTATRSCFHHTALDYVNYLTMLQTKKRPEILSTLMSYIQACSTYYHQGSDLCEDLGSFFKGLDDDINVMRSEFNHLDKVMQNRHVHVNDFVENLIPSSGIKPGQPTKSAEVDTPEKFMHETANTNTEGYLFKRTSNAFKTWNRRWFCMRDNKLFYKKRTGEDLPTVMEEDLRLCTVRPLNDSDRRFCFEVISPTKSHVLQADSEQLFNTWINALQKGIGAAIQLNSNYSKDMCAVSSRGINSGLGSSNNAPTTSFHAANHKQKNFKKINWQQILKIPGNAKCCDCGNLEPKWASINLGITLCIACSGVHRSLGVHYSKVRSLTLDAWEPEILRVMIELGNDVVNKIYESSITDSQLTRATENCEIVIREAWIKAKYIDKKFVLPFKRFSEVELLDSVSDNKNIPVQWSIRKRRRRSLKKFKNFKSDENASGINLKSDVNVMLLDENIEIDVDNVQSDIAITMLNSDQDSTSGEDDDCTIRVEDVHKLNPNYVLYRASTLHNLPIMCQAIALGADKNWPNSDEYDRTPLHQAIISGSVMACEYLLLNGARIDVTDANGYTPLHLATEIGSTAQAYLLLKHRAKYDLLTKDGRRPIDIAVTQTNADIVTLLRLTQLNDEIGIGEDGDNIGGDATYNDVMRDFSHLTCNQPQRLNRIKTENELNNDKAE